MQPATIERNDELERAMSLALAGQVMSADALCRIPGLGDDDDYSATRPVRSWYIARYGFAVPCAEAISAISAHGSVLEVGAGTGLWSRLVSRQANVVATDIAAGKNAWGQPVGEWHPVDQYAAADAVRSHPDRTVLMVWPSLGDPWAYEAAKAMKPGAVLCYVGEGSGGCTADDDLHDYLDDAFQPLAEISIPSFSGLRDYLWIGRKVGA